MPTRTLIKPRGQVNTPTPGAAFNIANDPLAMEIRIKVWKTTGVAEINVEDSVDGFSANVTRWAESFPAGITEQSPQERIIKARNIPGFRKGIPNAEIRVNLVSLTGDLSTTRLGS